MKQALVLCLLCLSVSCGGAIAPATPLAPPPKAAKARPKLKHALDAEQIQKQMRERVASMAACYELSPAKSNSVAGELTVEFTIEANGTVSGESLANDSIADKVLDDCVLGVVRKTSFPKADLSTDVSWPLRFGER